jgi:SAM-dependent methyltransferase
LSPSDVGFGARVAGQTSDVLAAYSKGKRGVEEASARRIVVPTPSQGDFLMNRFFWLLAVVAGLLVAPAGLAAQEPAKEKAPKRPDVIYLPTPQGIVEKMLEIANVKKDDVLYDLGCGDGRIPVTAAKKYGCKAFGFDIDPERVKDSQENIKKNKVEKLVTVEEKDIFTLDLSRATVVTLYLLPDLNVRLIPQLEKLAPGSRIVSHAFDMRGVKPDKEIRYESADSNYPRTIYLWTTPLKKEKGEKEKEGKDEK